MMHSMLSYEINIRVLKTHCLKRKRDSEELKIKVRLKIEAENGTIFSGCGILFLILFFENQ